MKKILCGLLCLALLFGMIGALSFRVKAEESEKKAPYPLVAMFDELWVGDVVDLSNYFSYDPSFELPADSQKWPIAAELTLLSGDCVEIDNEYSLSAAGITAAFTCIKPGKATIRAKIFFYDSKHIGWVHPGDGCTLFGTLEDTFTVTVVKRPVDKPLIVQCSGASDVKIKIGTSGRILDDDYRFSFQNLNYGAEPWIQSPGIQELLLNCDWNARGGAKLPVVGFQRSSLFNEYYPTTYDYFYRPGTFTLQPQQGGQNLCDPIKFTVAEPIITTNAPDCIKVGSSLDLVTALTGTALTDMKVSVYEDPNHYDDYNGSFFSDQYGNPVAYRPVITVMEGGELIARENGDYTNTLSSKETFTFQKTGTVKLKITYAQIDTGWNRPWMQWDGKDYHTITNPLYSPEKIITIQVTEDGKAPVTTKPAETTPVTEIPAVTPTETEMPTGTGTDVTEDVTEKIPPATESTEETAKTAEPENTLPSITDEKIGVTVSGNLPEGAALFADVLSSGNDYDRTKAILSDKAVRFSLYDINLQDAAGTSIQPDGTVEVSLPLPDGYSANVAVYRVEDDDALTKLESRTEDGRILFRTEHFSLYAIAELPEAAEETPAFPVLAVVLIVLIVLAAAAVVVILLLKKKRA